jgi:hypothetical protein
MRPLQADRSPRRRRLAAFAGRFHQKLGPLAAQEVGTPDDVRRKAALHDGEAYAVIEQGALRFQFDAMTQKNCAPVAFDEHRRFARPWGRRDSLQLKPTDGERPAPGGRRRREVDDPRDVPLARERGHVGLGHARIGDDDGVDSTHARHGEKRR